jgi:hypothetical protein
MYLWCLFIVSKMNDLKSLINLLLFSSRFKNGGFCKWFEL